MADTSTKFIFGKYAGTAVEDVPSGYLKWAAENWREQGDDDTELVKAINAALEYRDRFNCHFWK